MSEEFVSPEEIQRQRALGWPDFHPEDYCHQCGCRNLAWHTDAEEWNTAVEGRARGVMDILCTGCFAHLWETNTGRTTSWHLSRNVRTGANQ